MTDALREVNVNGVRYFPADDVERWHRGNVAKAEEWDELSERVEHQADALAKIDQAITFHEAVHDSRLTTSQQVVDLVSKIRTALAEAPR